MGQDWNSTRKVVGYTCHRVTGMQMMQMLAVTMSFPPLSLRIFVSDACSFTDTAAHWFAGQGVLGLSCLLRAGIIGAWSQCLLCDLGLRLGPQQQALDGLSCLSGPCFYFLMSANQCEFTLSLSHIDMNKMLMFSVYGIKWDSNMCVSHLSSHTSYRTAWSKVHPTTQLDEEACIAS